jgi:alcohol dehydrogenase
MVFELESVVNVRSGPGAGTAMASELAGSAILTIVDAMLVDAPGLQPLLEAGTVMTVSAGEPTVESVEELVERARSGHADTVVAVGGGSALDTGKITAAMLGHTGAVSDYLLAAKPVERSVELVAIPTTAGSGAEVTRTCVLSHEGRKSWMWDQALIPDTVVLDPELTVGMPVTVTVATGLDAFVHAVEAFTNVNRDDIADTAALAAIATIPTALPRVVADPGDLGGRRAMLEAATSAGFAIDRCSTALAHCVGHALAGFSKIPHGLAVALGLRATLQWSMQGDPARYAAVAAAMTPGGRLEDLVDRVDELYDAVGFQDVLRRYRTKSLDAAALATAMDSAENRGMAAANARAPQADELIDVASMVTAIWNRP